jgi:hypothetical protein
VELDERFRGSLHELSMHSSQPGAFDKLQVLIPPDMHDRWRQRRGFEAVNAATSLSAYHIALFTDSDYEQCRLTKQVLTFVEDRRAQILNREKDRLIREMSG